MHFWEGRIYSERVDDNLRFYYEHMNTVDIFLGQCRLDQSMINLFDGLAGILFFVKNKDSQIVIGNQLLAEHMGFSSVSELQGKDDFDVFPIELAEQYRKDDLEVMRSGKGKRDIIELFPNYLGDLTWFITSKNPLYNTDGDVCGLCGTLTRYENSDQFIRPFKEISLALDYLKKHYCEKISNEQLAQVAGLSVRQFEMRFKEIFSCTAHQYIIKLRILKSCKFLIKQNLTIGEVALEMGFYDQSAFSRTFKKHVGMSPMKYIKNHR